MDFIDINIRNKEEIINIPIGTSLLKIAEDLKLFEEFFPISAKINNKSCSLNEKIYSPANIEFIGIDSDEGQRIYLHSLSCIICKALADNFPNILFKIQHSLSNGYLFSLQGLEEDQEDFLKTLTPIIDEMIAQDLPFRTLTDTIEFVSQKFNSYKREDYTLLLDTLQTPYISYSEIDNFPDWYSTPLAPSTGFIKSYQIEICGKDFLLKIPSKNAPHKILPTKSLSQMKVVFEKQEELLEMLHTPFAHHLNSKIKEKKIQNTILVAEAMQEKQIAEIANNIAKAYKKGVRIVFISGPSSSGKTTFTKKLATQIQTCLLSPLMISMDDYFVERKDTPKDENGEYDFETLYALDLKLFNENLKSLLEGEKVPIPTFNFHLGKKEYLGKELQINEGEILLIEGIHALNNQLSPSIDKKSIFKVYVSALTTLNIDAHNRIATTDNRLLRRIVRDYQYRGYSAIDTLSRWESVRKGEDLWIFPFQENADAMFNSAMVYEMSVLRPLAEPLLQEVPPILPEYSEAQRLLKILRMFHPIHANQIPRTSIIREFIGDSLFS